MAVITPSTPPTVAIVTEHCAPAPVPVKDLSGMLLTLVTAYPEPLETMSKLDALLIAAPCPSTTPVTLSSLNPTASDAVPSVSYTHLTLPTSSVV